MLEICKVDGHSEWSGEVHMGKENRYIKNNKMNSDASLRKDLPICKKC